ncbi:hypothetical protein BHE74_00015077 [Ensete ventricosum]|nr:hypothetical protein BHE74_00015077 [Ensete ventricosum]
MDPIILESPTATKPLVFGPLADPNFHSVLKESIDRYLIEVKKESCDFSAFRSIFFRLLQSSVDPPIEVIWFYTALGYHEAIRSKRDVLDRVFAIRDLLQLLSACSASCNGPKSVALLAPVVSELYHCVREEKKLSGKVAKKLRKEIESLADGVVSYISICSGRSSDGQEHCNSYLLPCFIDIVSVWTVQHLGEGDGLNVLFPLVSDEIRVCFGQERCWIGQLAGIVVAEAFLLNLSLKVQVDGSPRPDLQNELKVWAVRMRLNEIKDASVDSSISDEIYSGNRDKGDHNKALKFEEANVVSDTRRFDEDSKKTDGDLFFFDNKGKADKDAAEDMETVDAAFFSAAHSMRSDTDKWRKRKEMGYEDGKSQVKFVKYKIHDNSVKDYLKVAGADGGLSSGSERSPQLLCASSGWGPRGTASHQTESPRACRGPTHRCERPSGAPRDPTAKGHGMGQTDFVALPFPGESSEHRPSVRRLVQHESDGLDDLFLRGSFGRFAKRVRVLAVDVTLTGPADNGKLLAASRQV